LRSAGGYDFPGLSETAKAEDVPWTARASPNVIALTSAPAAIADPKQRLRLRSLARALAQGSGAHRLARMGAIFRFEADAAQVDPPAVLLPFDRLFEIRAQAAMRLWRALQDSNPSRNSAVLSRDRRRRLMLALRALDAQLAGFSYREISAALSEVRIRGRAWKTHDRRGYIVRLAELGLEMMLGDYRKLLQHPYRRPPRRAKRRKPAPA
jgi:hypothetical protein